MGQMGDWQSMQSMQSRTEPVQFPASHTTPSGRSMGSLRHVGDEVGVVNVWIVCVCAVIRWFVCPARIPDILRWMCMPSGLNDDWLEKSR